MLNCFETVMPCDKEVLGSIPANGNNSFQDPVLLFNLLSAINGEKMCSTRVNLQGLNAHNNGPANRRTQSYEKHSALNFATPKKRYLEISCQKFWQSKNLHNSMLQFFYRFSSCKTLPQFYAYMVVPLQLHSYISRKINRIESLRYLF